MSKRAWLVCEAEDAPAEENGRRVVAPCLLKAAEAYIGEDPWETEDGDYEVDVYDPDSGLHARVIVSVEMTRSVFARLKDRAGKG